MLVRDKLCIDVLSRYLVVTVKLGMSRNALSADKLEDAEWSVNALEGKWNPQTNAWVPLMLCAAL